MILVIGEQIKEKISGLDESAPRALSRYYQYRSISYKYTFRFKVPQLNL